MAPGLSDHTPLKIQFHTTPRPKSKFQFCDMWSSHKDFPSVVASQLPNHQEDPTVTLCLFLKNLRPMLSKPHGANFADLKAKQETVYHLALLQLQLQQDLMNSNLLNSEKEAKKQYVAIPSSSLALIKQQCKIDWIKYEDDCTKLFFANQNSERWPTTFMLLQILLERQWRGLTKLGKS